LIIICQCFYFSRLDLGIGTITFAYKLVNPYFGGLYVKGIVEERAAMLGEYIIEQGATVRSAAKKFGISKSTVHKDVSQRLKNVNPALYKEVREILETNKRQRHIRGGIATKHKYEMLKKIKTGK
jgi:putative DeoR family transcriptional regulator (stage III sporulation protein D)